MTQPDEPETVQQMKFAIVALGYAVKDVEEGTASEKQRRTLAGRLENLATLLRDDTTSVVITSERADGIVEWGSIQ